MLLIWLHCWLASMAYQVKYSQHSVVLSSPALKSLVPALLQSIRLIVFAVFPNRSRHLRRCDFFQSLLQICCRLLTHSCRWKSKIWGQFHVALDIAHCFPMACFVVQALRLCSKAFQVPLYNSCRGKLPLPHMHSMFLSDRRHQAPHVAVAWQPMVTIG